MICQVSSQLLAKEVTGGPKPKLVLMKAEDERRCVFEHAATLKSGGEAPLAEAALLAFAQSHFG